jgi:hypothetical protein
MWKAVRRMDIDIAATPKLLGDSSSVLVVRQVLTTKYQERVLDLFLKGLGHKRFKTACVERHGLVLDPSRKIEDGESPVVGIFLMAVVDE